MQGYLEGLNQLAHAQLVPSCVPDLDRGHHLHPEYTQLNTPSFVDPEYTHFFPLVDPCGETHEGRGACVVPGCSRGLF